MLRLANNDISSFQASEIKYGFPERKNSSISQLWTMVRFTQLIIKHTKGELL